MQRNYWSVFINYALSGGIFKTLKWLNKDLKWHEAKRKGNKIFFKPMMLYLPVLLIILNLLLYNKGLLAVTTTGIVFLSVPYYCDKVLKPMIDEWYR